MCNVRRVAFRSVVVIVFVAVARAAAKVEKGRSGKERAWQHTLSLSLSVSPCRSCHFYSQKPSCLGQQQSPFAATCCNCCRIKCAARLRRISLLLWATRFYNPPTGLHHSPAPPSPLFPTLVDCTPPAEISLHFMLSDFRERRSRCSRLL